ncbi:hypothetical protein [Streptomyces avermitilis]|uniref:hypothetical protein n=1 Tax=Streptomyces avermitilis TaxID=33903 RepID=UPI00382533ED
MFAEDSSLAEPAECRPAVGGAAQGVHAHDAVGVAGRQVGALQLGDAERGAVGVPEDVTTVTGERSKPSRPRAD